MEVVSKRTPYQQEVVGKLQSIVGARPDYTNFKRHGVLRVKFSNCDVSPKYRARWTGPEKLRTEKELDRFCAKHGLKTKQSGGFIGGYQIYIPPEKGFVQPKRQERSHRQHLVLHEIKHGGWFSEEELTRKVGEYDKPLDSRLTKDGDLQVRISVRTKSKKRAKELRCIVAVVFKDWLMDQGVEIFKYWDVRPSYVVEWRTCFLFFVPQ